MTYNLFLTGELRPAAMAAALASLASLPIESVDVAAADDYDNRNWDAAISCTYEPVTGDVSWMLDIELTEAVTPRPTERAAAAHLAEQLQTPVLYPADEGIPSAYWLAAPGGLHARARLYGDDESDPLKYTIDAVERPVPSLPTLRVAPIPEVIREHRMTTPITDQLRASADAATGTADETDALWFVCTRLGAWEGMIARMTSGWPPDGWYPPEFYREDLETRDELAALPEGISTALADHFTAALVRVDDAFRAATVEVEPERVAEVLGMNRLNVEFKPGWWWRRLPASPHWEKA